MDSERPPSISGVDFPSRDRLLGHVYPDRPDVCPRVICAMEVRDHRAGESGREIVHSQWTLDYSITGGNEVRIPRRSDAWVKRGPRIAHLYAPSVTYWERAPSLMPPESYSAFILFEGGEPAGLGMLLEPRVGFAEFLDTDGTLFTLLHDTALTAGRQGSDGFWAVQSRFLAIVDRLMSSEQVDAGVRAVAATASDREEGEFARLVRSHLHRNVAGKVTIAEVAGHLGVSSSSLSHRYRRETGETPMRTLIRMRIDLAKGMLLKGYRLKEIAGLTGFCDEYHLSKAFKTVEGLSPTLYLKAFARPSP
jgi:AraC-like DNA-binding protein